MDEDERAWNDTVMRVIEMQRASAPTENELRAKADALYCTGTRHPVSVGDEFNKIAAINTGALLLEKLLAERDRIDETDSDEQRLTAAWSGFYGSLTSSEIRNIAEAVDDNGDLIVDRRELEFFVASSIWKLKTGGATVFSPVSTSFYMPDLGSVGLDDWRSRQREGSTCTIGDISEPETIPARTVDRRPWQPAGETIYAAKKPRVPWMAMCGERQVEVAQDSERGLFIVDPDNWGWMRVGASTQKILFEIERGQLVYESAIFVNWLDRPKNDRVAYDAVAKYTLYVERQRLSRYCTPLTPETDPYSGSYWDTCPSCGGAGGETNMHSPEDRVTCGNCGGSGYIRR